MDSIGRPSSTIGAALVVCARLLWACSGSEEGGPETYRSFDVQVGVWDPDEESFTELADGQQVELVSGFQGLVFVNLALLAERGIPARFRAHGEIVFDDFDERYPFTDNQVLFEPLDDDWRVVPSFRVPFGLPASALDGREFRLELEFESLSDDWRAALSRRFTIHDGNCVHTAEDEFVCE